MLKENQVTAEQLKTEFAVEMLRDVLAYAKGQQDTFNNYAKAIEKSLEKLK